MTNPYDVSEAHGRVALNKVCPSKVDTDGLELATRLGNAGIAIGAFFTGSLLTWLFYGIVTMLFVYPALSCALCIPILLSTILPFNPRQSLCMNVTQIVLLQIGPVVALVIPAVAWAYGIPLQIVGLY